MGDYIIIGDTEEYNGCLIYVCGSEDNAKQVLDRMLNDPNETDKHVMRGHYNLRIKYEPREDCWWKDGCD